MNSSFTKNGNVDALLNTSTKSGTWSSDITNYTITAAFPANAGDTLKRLNYTWKNYGTAISIM